MQLRKCFHARLDTVALYVFFFGPAHSNPLPLDDLVGEEFIDELKVVWLNKLLVSGG